MPLTHENYDAIFWAKKSNIIKGYKDDSFAPDKTINRAEFIKMIVSSTNYTEEMINSCDINALGFTDIDINAWYAPYLCIAKRNGSINGYPDGTFKPAKSISFAEAAKIIVKNFIKRDIDDWTREGHWYLHYLIVLDIGGNIPQSINTPSQIITRGELAEILYRLKEKVGNKPAHFYHANTDSFRKKHYMAIPFITQEPEGRTLISSKYAIDDSNVYFFGKDFRGRDETIILENVDTTTFEILGENVAKTKNVIIINGHAKPEIDGKSFQVLTANFSKDKNHIYLRGQILDGADVDTFKIDDPIFEKASDKNRQY